MAQTVKHHLSSAETWDRSLEWEDPLEEEMENHSRNSCFIRRDGQRSLVGYIRGHKKKFRAMAETTSFSFLSQGVMFDYHWE